MHGVREGPSIGGAVEIPRAPQLRDPLVEQARRPGPAQGGACAASRERPCDAGPGDDGGGRDYFVWTESGAADGLAPEGTPLLYTAPLTVSGDGGGELPDTDGSFTASDYEFAVDAAAGERFTFRNDGPEQLHHAQIFNFGDIDPAVVEENFTAFVSSEGEDIPEAFADLDFARAGAWFSGCPRTDRRASTTCRRPAPTIRQLRNSRQNDGGDD